MATKTIGLSMSGNSSVSSRLKAAKPNTMSAIIVTTVMIGRLIAKSEMNMARRYGLSGDSSVCKKYVSTRAPVTRRPLPATCRLAADRLSSWYVLFILPSPFPTPREINMKYGRLGMIALAALTFGAMPAKAQFPHLSVMGGISMPKGDAGDADNMGYNGGMGLGFSAPMLPIGIRIDAALHHFPGKENNTGAGFTAS